MGIGKSTWGAKVSVVGLGGLLAILLVAADAKAGVRFTFSAGLSADYKRLLEGDLMLLGDLKMADPSGEAQRLMQLKDASSASYEKWISKRARFIIDQFHPTDRRSAYRISNADYPSVPSAQTVSIIMTPGVNGFNQVAASNAGGDSKTAIEPQTPGQPSKRSGSPTIVMLNAGTMLYDQGRANRVLVGLKIDGGPTIAIKSPRVGLLQVGEGLFMRLSKDYTTDDLGNFVHSIYRLGTLFHEARHSDGNGAQLGMLHAICPAGHDYAGIGACDQPSNGSYRMGALFWKSVLDGCGAECTTKDKESVTAMYADSMSRILTPAQEARIDGEDSLCTQLLRVRSDIPFCMPTAKGTAQSKVIEWDDTPEYVIEAPKVDPMAVSSVGSR